ncbi:MAG: bile acid:sodium symporter family protein [Cyclobacteriaceae bacterium]|nr:bile acid:sodium symporter family protein [Cyclobacteriaceae bacterium]
MSGLCIVLFYPFYQNPEGGILLSAFFIFLALAMRGIPAIRGFSYTFIIFAAVSISMYFPEYFKSIGDFNLQKLIVPLLQIIMFGMGSQMSIKDFEGVVKMPQGVFVGIICQFSIMPLIAMAVLFVFKFPPEIAAGVILVGSSPSGLASNVMSFLARANLALSVTLTAVATLLAPLMTPLLMKFLAQEYVEIQFWAMMWSIIKMVIIPIALGLVVNRLARGRAAWINRLMPLVSMAGIAIIITIITAAGRDNLLQMGYLLIIACLLHNLTGYTLGYWICRILGMDEKTCRTISLEVGMQNGGLASGLAMEMGKVATVGLAPAVFGPMMNITGSSLATWWRSKKLPGEDLKEDKD